MHLRPWDFQGKSTGMGCHFFLRGIFPTQGSNPGLPHCRQMLLLSEPPRKLSSFSLAFTLRQKVPQIQTSLSHSRWKLRQQPARCRCRQRPEQPPGSGRSAESRQPLRTGALGAGLRGESGSPGLVDAVVWVCRYAREWASQDANVCKCGL